MAPTMKSYASACADVLPEGHREALRAGAEMVADHIFEDLQDMQRSQHPDWISLQAFRPEAYPVHPYVVDEEGEAR